LLKIYETVIKRIYFCHSFGLLLYFMLQLFSKQETKQTNKQKKHDGGILLTLYIYIFVRLNENFIPL